MAIDVSALYDDGITGQTIDVSATQRKFQQSIIIKQDPNKAGIISFLQQVEEQESPPQTNQETLRPSRQGSY